MNPNPLDTSLTVSPSTCLPTHPACALAPQLQDCVSIFPYFKKFFSSYQYGSVLPITVKCDSVFQSTLQARLLSTHPLVASRSWSWPSYQSLHFTQIILCSSCLSSQRLNTITLLHTYPDLHIPQASPTWTLPVQHVQSGLMFSPDHLPSLLYFSTLARTTIFPEPSSQK